MIWPALKLSLWVGGLATVLIAVFGTALGYLLAKKRFVGRELLDALLTMPMVLPPTVTGYYLILLLGRKGLLGSPLYQLSGWSITFTWTAAVVAATVIALPLMVKSARAAIESVEPQYEIASFTLGKGAWETFFRVTLPLAMRGIGAGIVLSFARAFGEFGATLMLAGNIPGKTQTLPLAIYEAVVSGEDERARWLAFLLTAISVGVVIVTNRLTPAQNKNPEMLSARIQKQFKSTGQPGITIDVSLAANSGITVLFGPSGAGKTTILRSIAGIVEPDAGRIALSDRVFFDSQAGVNLPIQQRRVGYVFQDHALFPHMTAERNIAYGARPRDGQSATNHVRELMALLHIEHAATRHPRELSGGEQQRVGLARALASGPSILLLDEPLSSVDVATRSHLLDEIVAVQRKSGIPFLYVTHSHAEAVRVGDFMHVLDKGRVIQSGKPLEVFNTPQTVSVARIVGTENIFVGRIVGHKADEGMTTIALAVCHIEAGYNSLPVGVPVTVGIRSEDILVARERITQTSARNVMEGTIKHIVRDTEKTELVVACGVDFKVSITAGTIKALDLAVGAKVFLLIKARAFHLLS